MQRNFFLFKSAIQAVHLIQSIGMSAATAVGGLVHSMSGVAIAVTQANDVKEIKVADAEAVAIDEDRINELLDFINTNRTALTKKMLVAELNKLGIHQQLLEMRSNVEEESKQALLTRAATGDMSVASPNQRHEINRRSFSTAAIDLVRRFLPLESNPLAFVETLRLTSPTPRVAWTTILHAIVSSFDSVLSFQIRPGLERLAESFKAGDSIEKLNSHLVLLNQNVEDLDKTIRMASTINIDD